MGNEKCREKIEEAVDIFVDTFCKRCEDGCCEGKEGCPLQMLLDGRVNLFGNSVFNPEDDLCVYDDNAKERAVEIMKKFM